MPVPLARSGLPRCLRLYGQLGGRTALTISATSLPLIVAITATVDLAAEVPLGA